MCQLLYGVLDVPLPRQSFDKSPQQPAAFAGVLQPQACIVALPPHVPAQSGYTIPEASKTRLSYFEINVNFFSMKLVLNFVNATC